MPPRTRLSPDARRDQLLELGSRMFGSRPYEDVWIEEVAQQAGVSRGLMYHYFPTKRAFFIAMLERETARTKDMTEPDTSADIVDQLRTGIDAYLGYCKEHEHGFRMIYNGVGSSDPEVQVIVAADIRVHERRIIAALSPGAEPHQLLRIAVRSWLAFMRAACYEWLEAPGVSREELRDLCVGNLIATVLVLPADAQPPVLPDARGAAPR